MHSVYLSRGPDGRGVLAFEYSPTAIAAVKAVPGREWDKSARIWRIPLTPEAVLQLKTELGRIGWALAYNDQLRALLNARYAEIAAAKAVRKAGDSEIPHDYVTAPYAHQRAGLEFLHRVGSGGLFWEMGLGKTKTAIDYAEWLAPAMMRERPNAPIRVLVIAPKTVCRNWLREIEKHAGHSDYVDASDGALAKRAQTVGAARYTVVNCEALGLASPLSKALLAREWDLVIADESTRFKNPKAARTKLLLRIGKKARRRVALTGTPITGKPEDAFAQLEFVEPGLLGTTFWAFKDRYLLLDDRFQRVIGVRPETRKELVERIDSRGYRILKSEVIDLPPKVYANRTVELTKVQREAYRQMREQLVIEIAEMPRVTAATVLTMLLRLTQITAGLVGTSDEGYRWLGDDSAKLHELDALLNEELAGEQVVIFGLYQRELEELSDRYNGLPPAASAGARRPVRPIIYGPTPADAREQIIGDFQAGNRRLLFAHIGTGGIGINLTAAKTAIYHTRGWSLEEYLQSQDRLHRIGQTGTVSVLHLVAANTIDEEIAEALAEKQSVADTLTGDDVRRAALRLLGEKP